MSQFSYTSIVINSGNSKQLGVPQYYYRKRSCDTNLTGSLPSDQYQRLKLIQNTVRQDASIFTANIGPLSAYKKPISDPNLGYYGVNWNQMSDRPVASVQKATIPTGFATSLNRRHTSVTSSKPGCQTPGGKGVDIKHNSYDRYLNRLKAKGPLKRGKIPPNFGAPIPFNPAYPIYGGKTIKTNIINGCNCPENTPDYDLNKNINIYPYPVGSYGFNVGDYVYTKQDGNDYYSKAQVIEINDGVYTIQFEDGNTQIVNNVYDLLKYFPCDCQPINKLFNLSYGADFDINCVFPSDLVLNKFIYN